MEEGDRATRFPHTSTKERMLRTLNEVLIEANLAHFLERALPELVDGEQMAHLNKIYALLGQVEKKGELRAAFSAYMKSKGEHEYIETLYEVGTTMFKAIYAVFKAQLACVAGDFEAVSRWIDEHQRHDDEQVQLRDVADVEPGHRRVPQRYAEAGGERRSGNEGVGGEDPVPDPEQDGSVVEVRRPVVEESSAGGGGWCVFTP